MDTGYNAMLTEKILQTHQPTAKESGRIFNVSRWVCTLHFTLHRSNTQLGLSRFANTDVSI